MENENKQQELLAKNLVYYRKASGLTQLELAEKFNYSDKSISKWERGEGFPDVFVLKSLADFYGITVDDFYIEEHKKIAVKHNQKRKQLFIRLLSIGIGMLVTFLTFFLLDTLLPKDAAFKPWLVFIYGLVVCSIIWLVWEFIYHKRFIRMFAVSKDLLKPKRLWLGRLLSRIPLQKFVTSIFMKMVEPLLTRGMAENIAVFKLETEFGWQKT